MSRKERGPATTQSLYDQYVKGRQAEGLSGAQILSQEDFYALPSADRRHLAITSHPPFASNQGRSGCPKKRSF
jgi:hypothetical protein